MLEAIGTNKLPARQINGSSYNSCNLNQFFVAIGTNYLPQVRTKLRNCVSPPLSRSLYVLDNVVKVAQGGQQRFFMYDSMGRLIRARYPEQSTNAALNLSDPISGNSVWSTGYQYDSNGNLTEKTCARGGVDLRLRCTQSPHDHQLLRYGH